MISIRTADILKSLLQKTAPIKDVDFVIHFPQSRSEDGFKKDAEGRYLANLFLNFNNVGQSSDMLAVNRIERAIGHQLVEQHANAGETWDDFNRRLRDEFVVKLQPISEEPIRPRGNSSGRYEWVLPLKVRAF